MIANRIIGRYDGTEPGPVLIFVAGIHGNELGGVSALQEVMQVINENRPQMKGSIFGLAGNLKAIEQEVRYINSDLNRIWLSEDLDPDNVEENEREGLELAIREVFESTTGDIFFFDLHSTSAPGSPFIMISDTIRNRNLARMMEIPIVLGLMEHLKGTLMDVTSRSGFPTIVFEAGKLAEPETIARHKAFIWRVLNRVVGVDVSALPNTERFLNMLDEFAPQDPNHEFYEILFHHHIHDGHNFKMDEGYKNMQPVKRGQQLATEDGERISAPKSGLIFMPLYQAQGNEGFYIIKPIPSIAIRFSQKVRLARFHSKLDWLLGVKKVSKDPLTYKVDEQVSFLWANEIFHLLGYIKIRQDGPYLYMTQREDERNPPSVEKAKENFLSRSYIQSELRHIKDEWRIPFAPMNVKMEQAE